MVLSWNRGRNHRTHRKPWPMVTIYKNGEFEAWNYYQISRFNFYENHNSKGLNFHWIFFLSNWNGISLEIVETDALTVWGQHVVLHFHSEFTKQLACHSISVELMKHFTKHLKLSFSIDLVNFLMWFTDQKRRNKRL